MNAVNMNALIAIAVVHLIATAMPGPNVLLVLRTAISRPRRDVGALIAGIAVSDATWALAAMIGISVVFAEVTWLYHLVRLVGAGYLVFLGVQTWRGARDELVEADAKPGNAFRVGLLANFTNPKTVVFFASVFASTLPMQPSLGLRAGVIAVMIINALWFHAVFALLCSHRPIQQVIKRGKTWIDRVTGALLTAFGIAILLQG
jgi:threonine efflux protein